MAVAKAINGWMEYTLLTAGVKKLAKDEKPNGRTIQL
jgi:hypothetical protein